MIEFNSSREYQDFRTHQAADAYYVAGDSGEYIVLPPMASFGISAHEYAHAIFHARGLQLPAWLGEGLAEVFSTVRSTNSGFEFGGALAARLDTLRRLPRITLSELLSGTREPYSQDSRDDAAIFYAETWAFADMLVFSPQYGRLDRLFTALHTTSSARQAFEAVYRKPMNTVGTDLVSWIRDRNLPVRFVSADTVPSVVAAVRVSDLNAGMLLADLLIANQEWTRAEQEYKELLRENPRDPKLLASLGTINSHRGAKELALENWRAAIEAGANDPGLCYRFALLAQDAGLPEDEITRALEQAIAAKPDFKDARYRLAIIESNRGNYSAAVAQLKAMGVPSGARAYSYWSALASCLSELGRTAEATEAAQEAVLNAKTSDERSIAKALEYTTKTDFHVQFEQDKNGQLRAVSIRTPHGVEWNPFIEAGDQIERTDGQLRSVECSGGKLVGFSVETKEGMLHLQVQDPTHVLMRNSPAEFNCGLQPARTVKVEFAKATAGRGTPLLRGMDFQ